MHEDNTHLPKTIFLTFVFNPSFYVIHFFCNPKSMIYYDNNSGNECQEDSGNTKEFCNSLYLFKNKIPYIVLSVCNDQSLY